MQDASDETLDALWLTALRWEDGALEAVSHTLPQAWLERARERRRRISTLDGGDKARALRAVASLVEPALPPEPDLPPRARALLCGEVDLETGRRWARGAPAPRRGSGATPGLRRWLARLAQSARP